MLRINVGRLMSENGERMDSEQEKPTSQQHASTPGATLAAAREAMGLTVEQVADQLKLAPRQVQAIEQGDFAALPNRAVTRGFIRAYAKAMRLDPAPLVAQVEVEGAEGHATATVRPTRAKASFQESRFPSLTERNNGKPLGAIVAGVGVLALIGFGAAWQMGVLSPLTLATRAGMDTQPAAEAPAVQPAVQPGTQPADAPLQAQSVPLISVPGTPTAGTPGAGQAPATIPGAGVPGSTVTTPLAVPPAVATPGAAATAPANRPAPTTAPVPASEAAAPGLMPAKPATVPAATAPAAPAAAPQPAPAAAQPGAPAVGAAGGRLVLTVKEDSWIEIRRPGQGALIARLVKAGSTETFNVREKDLLIVGKPGGVSANLAGAQLELPQVAGGTISRVNIK
ncbi:MAG: family transcriptional regulator [Pseudoduganella sp.]|jgi:cytoskeleton protein RodZ|nr:family transcriptional regulator [Pseudoduganella sp.]